MLGWRTGALSLDAAGCDPKAGAVLTRVPSRGARLMWGQDAPGGKPDSSPRGRTPISAHPPRALTWGREVTDLERGRPCSLLPLFNAPFSWAQLQFWGFWGVCWLHPPSTSCPQALQIPPPLPIHPKPTQTPLPHNHVNPSVPQITRRCTGELCSPGQGAAPLHPINSPMKLPTRALGCSAPSLVAPHHCHLGRAFLRVLSPR